MVIAVDFDNTICFSHWPGTGAPNLPVISKLKQMQAAGHHLVLWTCREGNELQLAVDWCREQGLVFEAVNDNPVWLQERHGNNCRKIGADYFLDDRALPIDRFLNEYTNSDNDDVESRSRSVRGQEDGWIPTPECFPSESDAN